MSMIMHARAALGTNQQDVFGKTLLHRAAADGAADEVARLLFDGADARICDNNNKTPYDCRRSGGDPAIAAMLHQQTHTSRIGMSVFHGTHRAPEGAYLDAKGADPIPALDATSRHEPA